MPADAIIQIGFPIAIIAIAMITGTLLERRHFKSIRRREEAFNRMPVVTVKGYPTDTPISKAQMVSGSTVVSIDYFKRFLASLRNIFGGEVRSYCSLLDRGRREAILRMKAQDSEADLIINLRVETSSVAQGRRKQLGSTEVLAYGTAVTFRKTATE